MVRSTTVSLALALLVSLFTTPALCDDDKRTCYALDGTIYPDVPCTSNGVTICCNPGDICLSNGLCLLQGDHGSVLSRGSCTDRNWGDGCFAPCSNYNRYIGFPIVHLEFNNAESRYCCGRTAVVDGEIGCMNGDSPFSLAPGFAIQGVAGLKNTTSDDPPTTTSASSPSSTPTSEPTPSSTAMPEAKCPASRDTAIGAGVGVPLGVIAVAALVWALMERRSRLNAISAPAPPYAYAAAPADYKPPTAGHHPAELGVIHPPSELMGSAK
ncbi:hypothetical protein FQN55_007746 [Onygenales sp. PD_40]|nr:hypothetical protein FQN55_007746 [Onygenales sp. PD_40]KAK2775376.1 hypothetical protein FQN53_003163 [Emmonsiellopsis sp. PD_33]KAK2787271.1 hypothetical protein FQN51_003431 [Onygenales sp. PD_10]KAK2792627.1 hypothetical protein FQN52_003132 [Onygenales sp. PD_12]